MSTLNFDARDQFLGQFPQNKRSTVANWMLEPVRSGVSDPNTVVVAVSRKAARTVREGMADLTRYPYSDWVQPRIDFAQQLFEALRLPIAVDYARYCIEYENLPQSEKDKMKSRQRDTYVQAHMQGLEPTEAQLNLLRRMGWNGQPELNNRAEASALIEGYLGQRRSA